MKEVLEKIKKNIQPGKSSIGKVAVVVKRINQALQANDIKAECVIGGSFAKNTHLKGDHDVDLFVRFNYEIYEKDDISRILGKIIPFENVKLHGSRDYYNFIWSKLDYEIIPVLKLDKYDFSKNVTDMSPLHVAYVNKHVKKNPGLNDEIRLAKQFCKANKIYGAESYIQGFSGHVIDLLVIHYGSFLNFINNASKWSNRVVIDMEKHLSNPLKELNKAKIQSPLVLVDPIQPNRNAAAALSDDKFELFKTRCKEFLKTDSEDFFKYIQPYVEDLEKKAGDNYLFIFNLWPFKNKNDVMGAKLKQVHEHIFTKLAEKEWKVVEADWDYFKEQKSRKKDPYLKPHGTHYFIIQSEVNPFIIRRGPPLTQRSDVNKFTKVNKNTYVSGDRVYAKIPRKYTNPLDLIKDILKQSYIKDRIKKHEFEIL